MCGELPTLGMSVFPDINRAQDGSTVNFEHSVAEWISAPIDATVADAATSAAREPEQSHAPILATTR